MKALVVLLALSSTPAIAQPASGTTASGLFFEVSGTGEPVVFVHAFSVDRRLWLPQVAAFEGRYRVIRYDLRGHGRSAAPRGPYTAHDDLREILDTLSVTRATLVGLSAGSEAATSFALAYPDRVTRLVLAGPGLGGYGLPPLPWATAVFQAAGKGDAQGAARLWAETPIMALRMNSAGRDALRSLVMDNARLWTFRRTEQPLTPPAVGRLGEIRIPVLLVVGDQDLPHIKEMAGVMAKGIANARLLVIPGAGHIVTLDAAPQFNDAVDAFMRAVK